MNKNNFGYSDSWNTIHSTHWVQNQNRKIEINVDQLLSFSSNKINWKMSGKQEQVLKIDPPVELTFTGKIWIQLISYDDRKESFNKLSRFDINHAFSNFHVWI